MSDILDILDEDDGFLQGDDGDFGWDDEDSSDTDDFALDVIEPSEMNASQAREITTAIQTAATATYILLAQAHEGKAYKAMGYETWAAYVKEEFELSASRSYQLLDLSKAVKMLEEASPDGTEARLTEAQVRSLKNELPQITEEVKEATTDKSADEASDIIGEIIEDKREQKRADDAAVNEKQQSLEEAQQDGYQKGLESATDAFLEDNGYNQDGAKTNVDGDEYPDNIPSTQSTGEGANKSGMSPEDSMNLYNFLNMLEGVDSLPEPERIIDIIPSARIDEVGEKLTRVAEWVQNFKGQWDEFLENE